jgi:NAD(P)-dependent dehydrogenase (short-subunit alcohol dehydrogenase family)
MLRRCGSHARCRCLAAIDALNTTRPYAKAAYPGLCGDRHDTEVRERPELFNVWLDMTPMGRIGEPSEIAAAVVYLACAASTYVAGAILSIDGGYAAW